MEFEQSSIYKDVERASNAIREEVHTLDDTVVDWGIWDSTYLFMSGKMEDYVASNLNERTLSALRLAFIVYLDVNGDIVWAQSASDQDGYVAGAPSELQGVLRHDSPLLAAAAAKDRVQGLLRLPEGVTIVVSCPIFDSEERGPKQGTLVMGRLITPKMTEDIAERVRLPLSLSDAASPLPEELAGLYRPALAPNAIDVFPVSDTEVAGLSVLPDILGKPALRVVVRQPRDILRRGTAVAQKSGGVLALGGALLLGGIVLLVERRVLRRLVSLKTQLDAVDTQGPKLGRVSISGADEINVLADRINVMLAEIESSRQTLALQYAEKKAQEAYLRQLLDSIQAGVVLVDPKTHTVLSVNLFAANLAQKSRDELIGRSCRDFLCPQGASPCPLDDMAQVDGLAEAWLHKADGSSIPILKSVSAIERDKHLYLLETFIDISELQKTKAALCASENQLRRIIETAPIGIFQTTPQGHSSLANARLASMLGYETPQDMLHSMPDASSFFVDHTQPTVVKNIIKQQGSISDYNMRVIRQDKQAIWISLYATAAYDTNGSILHYDGFVLDITKRKEAETEILNHRKNLEALVAKRTKKLHQKIQEKQQIQEELIRAKNIAEMTNRSKSEFLANMSHEIRTPLNGVLGMLQLLGQTELNEDQKECLELATHAAERLTRLLSDILDLSKIEAEKLLLQDEHFTMSTLEQSVQALFQLEAQKKGLQLIFALDSKLPELLIGDEARLRQILFNLVGNALKFTEKGSITIAISPLPITSPQVQRILFIVTDTGIGISDTNVKNIFDPFVQAEQSYTRHYQGAGLGLSIVRKLVKLMGGNLAIDNAPEGGGTAFYFALPFKLPYGFPEAEAAVEDSPQEQALSPKRILVVEDDEASQQTVLRWLKRRGHQATSADNGREALEKLAKEDFDLILMDIQLPVLNGLEATRAIRNSTSLGPKASIPIIALTAYAMAGDKEKFLSAGMDDYLVKPLDMAELARAIKRLLHSKDA
jgi:PAS domain S-box-containing protein